MSPCDARVCQSTVEAVMYRPYLSYYVRGIQTRGPQYCWFSLLPDNYSAPPGIPGINQSLIRGEQWKSLVASRSIFEIPWLILLLYLWHIECVYSGWFFKSCSVLQHSLRGAAEFNGTLFKCRPLLPLMLVSACLTTRGHLWEAFDSL